MFSRIYSIFFMLTVAILAAAMPNAPAGGISPGDCNTGPIQCCQTISNTNDPSVAALLGLLGVVLQGVAVDVGLTCTTVNIVGGTGSCSANPVCCENNNFSGLIAIGCVPVSL